MTLPQARAHLHALTHSQRDALARNGTLARPAPLDLSPCRTHGPGSRLVAPWGARTVGGVFRSVAWCRAHGVPTRTRTKARPAS